MWHLIENDAPELRERLQYVLLIHAYLYFLELQQCGTSALFLRWQQCRSQFFSCSVKDTTVQTIPSYSPFSIAPKRLPCEQLSC